MIDHTTCSPSAHDRSLPDPLDGQAIADDGGLACNDCGKPIYYCENDNQYHHVDPDAESCFLIPDPDYSRDHVS